MPSKNCYLLRAHIAQAKFRQILRLFCADLTADQAAQIAGLNRKTALRLFMLLRLRTMALAIGECPFCGQIEVDESDFGPRRVRGKRGRGAGRKTPVFGVLERGGKVYTQIVANGSKATPQAILLGKVALGSTVHSDGWHAYDGLVDVGFAKHDRIRHDQNHFAHDGLPRT